MERISARLWLFDRRWERRLHSQRISFAEWPKVGARFCFDDAIGETHEIGGVDVVEHFERVRFSTRTSNFELEKL